MDEFEQRLKDLRAIESRADHLRREVESKLYAYTLIPEARGDVLGTLESSDKVLNRLDETLLQFSIEIPEIPKDLHILFKDLSSASVKAVEFMIQANRAYFRELYAVRDHINKVIYYEKESDKIAEKIKRMIFRKDIPHSYKLQLGYFIHHIEIIADQAEDVCDRLAIATIKRYV